MKRGRIAAMIAGGVGLAALLFGGLSLAERIAPSDEGEARSDSRDTALAVSLVPVTFSTVEEEPGGNAIRLDGRAQPGSVVMLLNRGERVRQVKASEDGYWATRLEATPEPMAIEAIMFEGRGSVSVRGVETIFRLQTRRPGLRAASEEGEDAEVDELATLIMISAPGEPTRLIRSPFGGAPSDGPLSIRAIDYDDAGGVIISGTSAELGRVRLSMSGTVIGETRVGQDGSWAYIAGAIMPIGEYDIRAELVRVNGDRVTVSVPFERLPPLPQQSSDDGALSLSATAQRWQIRRALVGGGRQNTVIFAPE